MKAYTDLEQSKKLAEILPIESADMFYRNNGIDVKLMWEHNASKVKYPCWSLAALLNYLREVDYWPAIIADEYSVEMSVNYYDDAEGTTLHPLHKIAVEEETFVDAAVNLIIKLKENELI